MRMCFFFCKNPRLQQFAKSTREGRFHCQQHLNRRFAQFAKGDTNKDRPRSVAPKQWSTVLGAVKEDPESCDMTWMYSVDSRLQGLQKVYRKVLTRRISHALHAVHSHIHLPIPPSPLASQGVAGELGCWR